MPSLPSVPLHCSGTTAASLSGPLHAVTGMDDIPTGVDIVVSPGDAESNLIQAGVLSHGP